MTFYVLDTNIISLLLRNDSTTLAHFNDILLPDNLIIGCPLVWYEVQRGLLKRDARRQADHFHDLFQTFIWQDYTEADWALAATLWAQRFRQGLPVADADLLIGAFSIVRNAVLVTNNAPDFDRLGISIENWSHPT